MRNSNAYPSFQTSMVGLWFGVICVVVIFIFFIFNTVFNKNFAKPTTDQHMINYGSKC